MPAWLLELLNSKYFWAIGGGFILVILTYFKGRGDANKAQQLEQYKAQEKREEEIKKAEKANQELDKRREKDVQEINSASSASDVVKLLNSLFKTKD